ncbi:MAG: UvrD-helicase domain-containing protein, partial [Firmicutes bacterium]|nr:UvrD-helicase domain-containing protein [Bacillota bacterium]
MLSLDKLNPEQKKAALHKEGPLLILAGAGSGKTATMTHRIANLIINEHVPPYNILAVTFTNKAAGEMRERVEALVGSDVNMWIMTFHAACLRILRKHADLLGYTGSFAVYDPSDQKTVAKDAVKELDLDTKKYSPSYILSVISKCKERMLTPEQYLETEGENPRSRNIYKLYSRYEKTLKTNNAMDFDDLLLNTVILFDRYPEVLEEYRRRFRYIMVDEYQDTNHIQYRFIKALAEKHGNICVVGDDDQCIYQWRGADIRNILDFENDFPGTEVIKLEENYRSVGNILDCAHSVISNNRGRKDKKLWTSREKGEKISYFRADNEKLEAHHTAYLIESLKKEGRKYSDFAILYRMNAQSRNFEEALSAAEIPYRVLGGLRYYDRKEVKDIMCYMRLVQDKDDDLALVRIINEPKRGIGSKTLDKLRTLASVRGESLFDVLKDTEVIDSLSAKTSAAVSGFVEVIEEYRNERENLRVSDIYDGLLEKSGYLAALDAQGTIEAASRTENLLEFKSVIYDFEEADRNLSLDEFMERIALMADVDNHDPDEDAVVLMTLHSAKGLEF